jgi:endonuclease YncB( thermonuclease family)
MPPTQKRHEDIVIQRRFGENVSTRAVKQVYAVTYPGHTDQGTERESYGEAEQLALKLAEERGLSVWYEENPQSARRTLIKTFRDDS